MNPTRTKIVCTIGPASDSLDRLCGLIEAGMNVARLNFSHGSHQEHRVRIERIRQAEKRVQTSIAVLQDLSGPKIRIGKMKSKVELSEGQIFTITNRQLIGDEQQASVSYRELPSQVRAGDTLLLADGAIELKVEESNDHEMKCRVVYGGFLDSHKGINLPDRSLKINGLTDKDKDDLQFGLQIGVDLIALSFVRTADDVATVKEILKDHDSETPVIAKIEKHEALNDIDNIIAVSDGLMVARGDLALETSTEKVPIAQKQLIEKCNQNGKPVITATQMLKSMVENPRPTRAEAADVANAVLDGSDAVMLSEETAIGNFPVKTVRVMNLILREAEQVLRPRNWFPVEKHQGSVTIPAAISHAVASMANELSVRLIITPTQSGATARMVARYRPQVPVLAVSPLEKTVRQLTCVWGIIPIRVEKQFDNTDKLISACIRQAKDLSLVDSGDYVLIAAGIPPGVISSTNLIKVEKVE